jgi:phage terminase large subunit-like protein
MNAKKIKVGPWEWTPWPTQPLPDEAWLRAAAVQRGLAWVNAWHETRENVIAQEVRDPLRYGWEAPPVQLVRELYAGTYRVGALGVPTALGAEHPQGHQADDLLFMAGNRTGKTTFGGRLTMETLAGADGRFVRCWSQNEERSITEQQRMVAVHLPPVLRGKKRVGGIGKISYSQATGFSDRTLVLPHLHAGTPPTVPGSQCIWMTYHQWRGDKTVAEGGEADLIWCDEEVPGELLETLRFRTGTRRMRLLVTFTPLQGYTDAVAQYLEGADILETAPARRVAWDWWKKTWAWGDWLLPENQTLVKGCPPGHVPLVLKCNVPGRYAVVCGTPWNPYIALEDVIKKAEGRPLETKLTRWFGWPNRRANKAFERFSAAHVVPADRLPPARELKVWLFADPHGRRNWFLLWIGVDAEGTAWVLKEWPDASIGEWSVPGDKPDGQAGPAQRDGGGKSFDEYKRIILTAEGWAPGVRGVWRAGPDAWRIEDRRMDPRPAGTAVASDGSERTYLDYMLAPVMNAEGETMVPGLDFVAAPACDIEEGTQLINDWLTMGWDDSRPVDPLNCPQIYVSAACENLIWSLKTWTGQDGEKGASKDPVDCLKAAAKMRLWEMLPGSVTCTGGGSY